MAVFCDSGFGLQTPGFEKCEAHSSKVSGRYREYSRFPETAAGDQVRSPLRGVSIGVGSERRSALYRGRCEKIN